MKISNKNHFIRGFARAFAAFASCTVATSSFAVWEGRVKFENNARGLTHTVNVLCDSNFGDYTDEGGLDCDITPHITYNPSANVTMLGAQCEIMRSGYEVTNSYDLLSGSGWTYDEHGVWWL